MLAGTSTGNRLNSWSADRCVFAQVCRILNHQVRVQCRGEEGCLGNGRTVGMRCSFTTRTRHSGQFCGWDRTGHLLCGIEHSDIVSIGFHDDYGHTGIEPGLRGRGSCHVAQFTRSRQWPTNELRSARQRDDR